ncbi:MAG: DUF342 domain-containing protein, partial [Acidobacteria bacterium]|nr:DUF342 domain-containing protein [Acidobacteriota bacterium]
MALWQPGAEGLESTVAVVHATLDAQGLGDFFIDDSAITTFLDTTKTAAEPVEAKIGMRCDGACSVSVSEDKMTARLWIGRAYRGTPVSDAQVRESLRQAGVVAGILEDVIATSLAAGEASDVVVATGRLPENGVDSEFVALVADSNDRRPHADEHGIIDYRDLGSITTVKVGTPVMRRTPATPGVDGTDVKGTALKAKPGKNTPYATKVKGVAPDPADPELLCSAIVGHPVLVTNGMSVEP